MSMNNDKYSVMREYFGHSGFREGQEEMIDAILSGRDSLGIMPTGAGKSVCYQIPALMFDGITIVISPLISLMKDQVSALIQSGVRGAYLNSSLTPQQYDTAIANAKRGMYKLIYVAPERLCTPSFLSLANSVRISMVAVDEAHCVSQWGHDFRPSYLKIPEFLAQLNYRPIVSAFTATATKQVREDIVKFLGLNSPVCVTTGFDRKNLYFGVIHASNKYEHALSIVRDNADKSGIIYCSTRKAVDEVCEKLNADGIPCTRYHAGLSDEERRRNQDDFIYDRVQVIAATNAFGMGIDKSNVAYVIHYNMPKNIENYYQEAGRAGRDGNEAKCILLYSERDVSTNIYLINNSNDNPDLDGEELEEVRRRDMKKLDIMRAYCNTGRCLREFILDYFGDERPCTCGNCSNCSGEVELTDVTIEAQKILSCVYRLHQRNLNFGASVVSQILKGSNSEKIRSFRLDSLSTYGIMSDDTEVHIRTIIRCLMAEGYLAETEHRTLTLTRRAAEVLKGTIKVELRLPKKSRISKKALALAQSFGMGKGDGKVISIDTGLFDRLRKLRTSIASKEGVPPYIVFNDATLRDMCIKLPRTQSELLEVSGVGRVKQEKYGQEFTAEIIKYLAEGNEPETHEVGTDILDYVRRNKESLTGCDEEFSLSQLCDEIQSQLGVKAEKKKLNEAIKQWLINENYLSEDRSGGQSRLTATILTAEAGLLEVEKISKTGGTYKSIVFPRSAQEFIFENIDEIFALSNK